MAGVVAGHMGSMVQIIHLKYFIFPEKKTWKRNANMVLGMLTSLIVQTEFPPLLLVVLTCFATILVIIF